MIHSELVPISINMGLIKITGPIPMGTFTVWCYVFMFSYLYDTLQDIAHERYFPAIVHFTLTWMCALLVNVADQETEKARHYDKAILNVIGCA